MDVQIVVFDGFDELDAIGPYEVFSNAAWAGADLTVTLRTTDDAERVTASHGVRIETDGRLGTDRPDLVVVPGGGWNDQSPEGAWAEAERGTIPRALADLYAEGATVASVCTGGMLLARAGLLKDQPATTHEGAVDDLADAGVDVVDARVVDAGDIVTAGGVTSGLDMALYLVEREFGDPVASAVEREMSYEVRGPVYRA